jgi:ERCC4-type nuclease
MNAQAITIIVDTREQRPYFVDDKNIDFIRASLKTGDYSAEGYKDRICVERKSKSDLINTITRNRKRFFSELERMKNFDFKCVVVECSLEEIILGSYDGGISPAAMIGSIMSVIINFGVPVYFCTNRIGARIFTKKFLESGVKSIENLNGK